MSAPAKCPGCATKLQPDWEACPNCPMSFGDAPPRKTALQSDGFRNVVVPLLLLGGLFYFIWGFGLYMKRAAEEGTRTIRVVPKESDARIVAAESPILAEGDGDQAGEEIISIMPEKARMEKPRTDKAVSEWKMRGVVYDLATLKPVPGAYLTFIDNETNSRARIVTDAQGRYRAILPALSRRGYLVTLAKPGYAQAYLNPGTEGVREMPLELRRQLVKELSSMIDEPASIHPNSGDPLVTDFHMAPKR